MSRGKQIFSKKAICALLLTHHADAPNVANASLSQTQQRFAISLEECAQRNRATRQVQPHSRLIREL